MQIVINIPEDVRNRAAFGITYRQDLQIIGEAIANGTPLPEHHGRLVDADIVQYMARKKAEDCFPEGRYYYGYRKSLFEFAREIDNAPTIVEADKEAHEW